MFISPMYDLDYAMLIERDILRKTAGGWIGNPYNSTILIGNVYYLP